MYYDFDKKEMIFTKAEQIIIAYNKEKNAELIWYNQQLNNIINKGTPMENKIKELENQLKNNKELFKIIAEKRDEYHDKYADLERDIQKMENKLQNLKDQQCPKASDFPCLKYCRILGMFEKSVIGFIDKEHFYCITNDLKQIEKHTEPQQNNINEKIHVQKCKFSDIKEGDYFIFEDKELRNNITAYNYCFAIDNLYKSVYFPLDGLITKHDYSNSIHRNKDVYKFTIKEN